MNISFISYLLAFLTLISHITLIAGLLYFGLSNKTGRGRVLGFFSRNGMLLAFIISLVSTLGSLFYSEIAGFDPCRLCWFQRIFMYPQVLLLGIALYKKQYFIIPYSISLAIIGGLIALYHNYIYFVRTSTSFCGISADVSCLKRYVFEFGYITIPVMSITAFVLILVFLFLQKRPEY